MLATFRHLMGTTTAHGLPQIQSHKSCFMKCFWFILLLGATGICVVHMYTLINRYLQEPTAVSLNPDRVDFIPPDIFFCNLQFLSTSRLIKNIEENSTDVSSSDLRRHLTQLENFFLNDSKVSPKVGKKYFWSSVPWDLLHKTVGHRREQTFFSVKDDASASQVNISRFQAVFNDDYFSCFRYQPVSPTFSLTRKLVVDLYLDNYNDLKVNRTRVFGEPLNHYDFDRNGIRSDVSMESGMAIRFLQRNYSSSTSNVGAVFVSAGKMVQIFLKMTKIEHQSTKIHPCRTSRSVKTVANLINSNAGEYVDYNQNAFLDCLNKKMLTRVVEKCGCYYHKLEAEYDVTRQYPACGNATRFFDEVDKIAAFQILEKELDCAQRESKYEADNMEWVKECEGVEQCDRVEYDPFVSVLDWPTSEKIEPTMMSFIEPRIKSLQEQYGAEQLPGLTRIRNIINKNDTKDASKIKRFLKENFVRVIISPHSSKGILMTEEFSYPFTALLAEIGGIFGLYLGMSVLTLFEIFNFYPHYQVEKRKHKRYKRELKSQKLKTGDAQLNECLAAEKA